MSWLRPGSAAPTLFEGAWATSCKKAATHSPTCCQADGDPQLRSGIAQSVENLKKVGRDWHHHSRALRHRSMGQGGDDRLPGLRSAPKVVPRRQQIFQTRLSD